MRAGFNFLSFSLNRDVPPESDGRFYRSLNERFFTAFRMTKVFFA